MIYVGPLTSGGAPWRGGVRCRMVSDRGLEELVSFGSSIGARPHWIRRAAYDYFELSPGMRQRAVAAGAVPLSAARYEEVVAAAADRGVGTLGQGGPCRQPGRR